MTASSHPDRERAEDEAAAWLVDLSERPDDAGIRARFEAWRSESALNAEVWARTRKAYALAGRVPAMHMEHWQPYVSARNRDGRIPAPGTWAPAEARRGRPRRRPLRAALMAAAAAIAACLVVAAAPGVLLRLEADAVTATGEVRSLVLADGTRVRLAPESAVDVAVSRDERRVRLLAGSAFFEVASDPARPFRVAAGGTETMVLGTAFEVRKRENGAVVAVQHGRVSVEGGTGLPQTREVLQAGEWVRVTQGGPARRGRIPADEVASWVRGELIVRDRPIGEIVEALRSYFDGVIVVRAGGFATHRVSGVFSLRDPVTTLRELAASRGASTLRPVPWLILVTDG